MYYGWIYDDVDTSGWLVGWLHFALDLCVDGWIDWLVGEAAGAAVPEPRRLGPPRRRRRRPLLLD